MSSDGDCHKLMNASDARSDLEKPIWILVYYFVSLEPQDEEQGRPWIDCHKRIDLLENMCLGTDLVLEPSSAEIANSLGEIVKGSLGTRMGSARLWEKLCDSAQNT